MMALSVQDDETALELFRRANHKPLRTGLAFFDEVGYGFTPRMYQLLVFRYKKADIIRVGGDSVA